MFFKKNKESKKNEENNENKHPKLTKKENIKFFFVFCKMCVVLLFKGTIDSYGGPSRYHN